MEHFKRGHKVLFFPFPFGGGEGGEMGAYKYINTVRDSSYIFGGDTQLLMHQNDASFDYHSTIMNTFIHKRMSLETIKVKERQPGVTKHHQHKEIFEEDQSCFHFSFPRKLELWCTSPRDIEH